MVDDALAAVVARLYSVVAGGFVTVRSEEVAKARKARDTGLAAAIGKLRKPTVAAWLVNLLAHERPDLVQGAAGPRCPAPRRPA